MTKEEYLRMTNIASEEEAHKMLRNVNGAFLAIVFFSYVVPLVVFYIWDVQFSGVLQIANIIFWVIFTYYCWTVKKAQKISKVSALFAWFFAPLSWIWFYPQLTEPLRIIIGEKQPPTITVDQFMEEFHRKPDAKASNTRVVKTIVLVSIGVIIFLIVSTILLAIFAE